jgi:hypothetical protein
MMIREVNFDQLSRNLGFMQEAAPSGYINDFLMTTASVRPTVQSVTHLVCFHVELEFVHLLKVLAAYPTRTRLRPDVRPSHVTVMRGMRGKRFATMLTLQVK